MSQDDDIFYEAVAAELQAGDLRAGLWARAFAEADGEERVAKARYIKLRVSQLKADHESAVRGEAEAQQMRLDEERRRNAAVAAALERGHYRIARAFAFRAQGLGLSSETIRMQLESQWFPAVVVAAVMRDLEDRKA